MTLVIGSDHAGFSLKTKLIRRLAADGHAVEDLGTHSEESCDYPEIAYRVAERVAADSQKQGILICGTGNGMAIVANKVPGIRAALVFSTFVAQYAREHNNANILVLPGRIVEEDQALGMVRIWLDTKFAGGRHQRRLDGITEVERKISNGHN